MQVPIATLSMYDWPETRPELERFWLLIDSELRKSGVNSTASLQNSKEQLPLWLSPDLLVGQTCGWPYANLLHGKVIPFATFDYGLEGCAPGTYRSVFIGQNENDRQHISKAEALKACPRIAINGSDSQSGFHVFSELLGQPASSALLPDQLVITGAHRNSVQAIANGNANLAAIDAVAFELAKRHEAEAVNQVKILGYSQAKPGLPLITSPQNRTKIPILFKAIESALKSLAPDDKDTLLIKGVLPVSSRKYDVFAEGKLC